MTTKTIDELKGSFSSKENLHEKNELNKVKSVCSICYMIKRSRYVCSDCLAKAKEKSFKLGQDSVNLPLLEREIRAYVRKEETQRIVKIIEDVLESKIENYKRLGVWKESYKHQLDIRMLKELLKTIEVK